MAIKVLGIDIAKNTFQLHGADEVGKVGFNAAEFFPEQPGEMWLWPKGVLPSESEE